MWQTPYNIFYDKTTQTYGLYEHRIRIGDKRVPILDEQGHPIIFSSLEEMVAYEREYTRCHTLPQTWKPSDYIGKEWAVAPFHLRPTWGVYWRVRGEKWPWRIKLSDGGTPAIFGTEEEAQEWKARCETLTAQIESLKKKGD
jgi:hypothetical protein